MAELERRKSDCNDNPSGSNDCLLLQRRANKHHHREPTTHQPKKNDQIVTRIANNNCDEIEHLRAELESETKNRWVVSSENKNIFSAHRRWRNSRLLALSAVLAGNQCGAPWGERNCGTVSFSLPSCYDYLKFFSCLSRAKIIKNRESKRMSKKML